MGKRVGNTRKQTMVEVASNQMVSYFLATFLWTIVIATIWNVEPPVKEVMGINILFLIVFTFKDYLMRRLFNWLWNRK